MRKRFIPILAILLLLSCTNKHRHEDKIIFCYNESANITSLDPAYARSMSNTWAINQIFNGLVQLDEDLNIKPCIAHSWTISDDGKVYTFFLRNDVLFHEDPSLKEGRTVVASDVVYSFNRILDPSVASPGTWIFQNVATDKQGKHMFTVIDSLTVEITLQEAFPPFLGLLAMQYCSIIPFEAVNSYGDNFRSHPIGTGPFHFSYWKENNRLVLLKNPHYFEIDENGNRLPFLDAVNITFIVDKQTAFLDFLKGNIDMVSGIDASYKDALLNKDGSLKDTYSDKIYVETQPFLNTEYLGFQLDSTGIGYTNPALNDVRVRQAINYCFDRVKMIRYLRNNMGIPGIYGFVPPSMPGFQGYETRGYTHDPEKAATLLAEAGFPGGKGLGPITLTTTSNYLDLCQYIQHEAAKTGIVIKIDVTQPATLREMIAGSKLQFFRASWIADYPDAENYLSLFYSGNFSPDGPNYTHFSNSDFDQVFKKAISTMNDSARFELYRELDQMIMAQAPVVVLYYDRVVRFINKSISGIGSNPMNMLTLKYVKKKI